VLRDVMPMRIFAGLREWWIAFWRGADTFARAVDVDGFEDMHSRLRRLEEAVFGNEGLRSASASVQGSDPGAAGTPADCH